MVTFERTDPFYVLDLSNPDDPRVLGELEIPGFSQFMHPIKDRDNSMLIAVGQAADEEGLIIGLQISLFDSTIPTNPQLVDRLLVEDNPNASSGTSAAWDERAFRYIQVGEVGRLIIPVSIYSNTWDNFGNQIGDSFEGFMVFGVDLTKSEDMISREFEIDHSSDNQSQNEGSSMSMMDSCYCYSWLPERSMVFSGDLMTLKNQKVISTNLSSQQQGWTLLLDQTLQCCPDF